MRLTMKLPLTRNTRHLRGADGAGDALRALDVGADARLRVSQRPRVGALRERRLQRVPVQRLRSHPVSVGVSHGPHGPLALGSFAHDGC